MLQFCSTFFVYLDFKSKAMEITIKFDQRKKETKALLEYLNNLPYIEVVIEKPRYNAETEKAIQDVRNGKTFKVKNSKQLFKELGI